MLHLIPKVINISLLLCISSFIYAHPSNHIKIENIQSSEGLINNHVLCSFQDSRGILWVGTYSGVQSYDGNEFRMLNNNGNIHFSNHVILTIAEDKNGNLWFGTEFGLNKYNFETGEIKQFIQPNEEPDRRKNYIKKIVIDDDGIIWMGTYGAGLIAFSEKSNTFEYYQNTDDGSQSLQSNLINSLFIDKSGLLWVATENGGLSVFDRKHRQVLENFNSETNGFPGKIVNCTFQDYYGNFWFGTWNNGLIKYSSNDNTFTTFNSFTNNTSTCTVRSIEQTDKNFLWIATYGDGLYRFDLNNESFSKIDLQDPIKKNTKQDYIWNLNKDSNNNLWISSFGSGLFHINTNKNRIPSYILFDNNHSKISISCFVEDLDGTIWIGTYGSGIYQFNPTTGNYIKYETIRELDSQVNSFFLDSHNTIWVCTENGLFRIFPNRKNYTLYRHSDINPNGLTISNISSVTEDQNGNIWIGLWGGGINILNKDQLKYTNSEDVIMQKLNASQKHNPIINNTIWKLFSDSRGNIWITSPSQLMYFNSNDTTFHCLEIYAVSSLYETESGNIWATSMGNGLYLLDKNDNIIKTYNENDEFPSTALSGLMSDNKGRLWLGTSKGIAFLNPANNIVGNFDKSFGLEFSEANLNAFLKLKSGEMLYGGNEGFNIFTPETMGLETFNGHIYINNIKVLFEDGNSNTDSTFNANFAFVASDTISFKSNSKVIAINFSAIDYSNPQGIKYAYYLEGFDTDWICTNYNNRQAIYSNLPAGKYTFRVKASYNAKNWGVQQAKLVINIEDPIYKAPLFKSLLLLVIIVILALLVKYIFSLKRKEYIRLYEQLLRDKKEREEEKELLRRQNEELNLSIIEKHEQVASLAYQNLNSIDKMSAIYNNLKEIEKNASPANIHVVKSTIQLFEEEQNEFTETNDNFKSSVNLAFDNFQQRLSIAYPKLTHKDLRICSYIRMNKTNKEIAQQLNITIGSLETSRYRLRKKIGLSSNVNLNDFLIKF